MPLRTITQGLFLRKKRLKKNKKIKWIFALPSLIHPLAQQPHTHMYIYIH